MEKRVNEKYADLKVGDTVVRHMENSSREKPTEFKITKIGKKYIHIDAPYYDKFNRERGYGEFGYGIFPGTLAEYLAWKLLSTYSAESTAISFGSTELRPLTIPSGSI